MNGMDECKEGGEKEEEHEVSEEESERESRRARLCNKFPADHLKPPLIS